MCTTTSTADILHAGMKCLTEHLGVVRAEQFVSLIIREQFDYTKWQREYFDELVDTRISEDVEKYIQESHHTGQATTIL